MPAAPFLTVIAGPTASGKSALAIELAERWGAEIVSADSQAVYRHFDIGTAKPPAADLKRVPHHLISAVEPLDAFSAGRFQAMADQAIAQIASRGRPAIVVGGTGLYVRALLHGVMPAPTADPEIRARLEAEAKKTGWPALHARLAEVDPPSARVIQPTDRVRIIRALEIFEKTGRAASAHRAAHAFRQRRYAYRLFVLDPPRAELYAAIDLRTRRMFDDGLMEETASLLARGYADAPAMKAVGYAQALAAVRGELTKEAAVAQAAQATRRYAKRQLTWFRKEDGAQLARPPYDAVRVTAPGDPP